MTADELEKYIADGKEIPLVWKDGKLIPYNKIKD